MVPEEMMASLVEWKVEKNTEYAGPSLARMQYMRLPSSFLILQPSKRIQRVLNLDKKSSMEEKLLGSKVRNSFSILWAMISFFMPKIVFIFFIASADESIYWI